MFMLVHCTANKSAAGSCEDSCLSEEAVSEEVWEMIERFLRQQHELRRMKRQMHQWRVIADELSDHMKKQMEYQKVRNCKLTCIWQISY
jgi:predicted transcriptional regulator